MLKTWEENGKSEKESVHESQERQEKIEEILKARENQGEITPRFKVDPGSEKGHQWKTGEIVK